MELMMTERVLFVPAVVKIDTRNPPVWWKNWRDSHAIHEDAWGLMSYPQNLDDCLHTEYACRAIRSDHKQLTLLFSNESDFTQMVLSWS